MKRNQIRLAAAAAIMALSIGVLTGCGAKNEAPNFETAAASGYSGNRSYDSAPMMAEDAGIEDTLEGEAAALTSGSGIQPVQTNRKLIRTAYLTVESTEFDNLLENINQSITALDGYLEQSDISGSSISASSNSRRYAYMVARIPSDKFDQFITKVGEQANITNKSESTQDVTLQYSDIESRKKSLTIEQERIWALLEKAETLEAVITLESRLSEIRYQLESFESQLRLYDNQVDYSTVTLNINEVQVFTPTAPDSVFARIEKGFNRNLTGVSNALVNFFVWFVSSIPILLLLGVIVVMIVLIVCGITKRSSSAQGKSFRYKAAHETRNSLTQKRGAPELNALKTHPGTKDTETQTTAAPAGIQTPQIQMTDTQASEIQASETQTSETQAPSTNNSPQ